MLNEFSNLKGRLKHQSNDLEMQLKQHSLAKESHFSYLAILGFCNIIFAKEKCCIFCGGFIRVTIALLGDFTQSFKRSIASESS